MPTKSTAISAAVAASGAVLLAAFAVSTLADWPSATPVKTLTIVYVGADDCAPCDVWQRDQGTAFRDSPEFRRLTYREVKSPNLFDVLKDKNWPEELRGYRPAIGEGAGVPLWLVIADDQIVMQGSGLTQWRQIVLPKIKSLLRQTSQMWARQQFA